MSTNARAQLNGAGYAAQTVTKAPAWHGLVAWDLQFNNLTTGLFLTAALGELAAPEVFTPVAKAAYPIALILLVTDLLCLVLDLGDPWRFHHMLRVFKPSSPMSLGTWCLTVYSLPLTVAAVLSIALARPEVGLGLLPGDWPALEWVRKTAVILGVLPALGSAAYKGVLLSTNSQPGWRDARWLGGYLTNSALLLGCATMLVLSILLGQEKAIAVLRPALALLLVLNVAPLVLLVAALRTTLSRKYAPGQLRWLGTLSLVGGVLIPLCLLLIAGGPFLSLAAVLFLLLSSLLIRYVVVFLPH